MTQMYSLVAHDEEWVDEFDTDAECVECGDGVESPAFDDGEAFCRPCYRDIFGED